MVTPRLWVAHGQGAAVRQPDGRWEPVLDVPGHVGSGVMDLALDAQDGVWFSGYGVAVRSADGNMQHFTAANGLTTENVSAMAVDLDGQVWLAPNGGETIAIHAPDGSWSYEGSGSLGMSNVRSAAVDAAGNVWFGSFDSDGVAARLADGTWRHFTTADGLADDRVWAIQPVLEPEGDMSIWFATFGGLSRLRLDGSFGAPRVTATPSGAATRPIPTSPASRTPTPTRAPVTVVPTTAVPTAGPGATATLPSMAVKRWEYFWNADYVADVAVDARSGDVWAATSGGVVRWPAGKGPGTVFTESDGLPATRVEAIALAPDGTVWAGTRVGAATWHEGSGWTSVKEPHVAADYILCIAVGPDGAVWLGSEMGAARRDPDGGWQWFPAFAGGLASTPTVIAFDTAGNIWFGTYGSGVSVRRRDGSWRTYAAADGLRGTMILTLGVAPDGVVWSFSYEFRRDDEGGWTVPAVDVLTPGASRWRPADLDNIPHLLARDKLLYHVAWDGAGRPWFSGTAGLLVPGAEGGWHLEPNATGAFRLSADGGAWVGTNEGLGRRAPDGSYTLFRVGGLPSNNVSAVAVTADGTWLATDAGAARRSPDGSWRTFTEADGLAGRVVNDVAAAADGTIWFATADGASRRSADGMWATFTTADGLAGNAVSKLYLAPDGSTWCLTWDEVTRAYGISRYRPDGTWDHFSQADGLASSAPRAIGGTTDGSVWVGFGLVDGQPDLYNLARYEAGRGWQRVDVPGTQARDSIQAIAGDGSGGLWLGLARGLVFRAADGTWTPYSADPNLQMFGDALAVAPDGSLWVGGHTSEVRRRRPDFLWEAIRDSDGLQADAVVDFAFEADGHVWLATRFHGARRLESGP